MHKFLFYNKFITFLYMFRAVLCSRHVQEYNKLVIKQEFVHSVGQLLEKKIQCFALSNTFPGMYFCSGRSSNYLSSCSCYMFKKGACLKSVGVSGVALNLNVILRVEPLRIIRTCKKKKMKYFTNKHSFLF